MIRRAFATCAIGLLAVACSTGDGDPAITDAPDETSDVTQAPAVDEVAIELGEWSVLPDPDRVQADKITFDVSNLGQKPHEFAIVRTDLDPDDLPTADDGSVDEDELKPLGEVEEIQPEGDGKLEVELTAGSYVLFCNLVEEAEGETEVHYKLGMRTPFEVF